MKLLFVNSAGERVSKAWLEKWLKSLSRRLAKEYGYKLARKELVVVLVDREEMQRLNRTFRKIDKPTDILSFESAESDVVGELVICMPEVKRQAREFHRTQQEELGYMVVHGVLHLLGFDHDTVKAEERMFAMQDQLFDQLIRS